MRHGWSQWNEENRFTGWVNVPLHSTGEREADEAGDIIRGAGLTFDVAFTSVLRRAIDTTFRALHHSGQSSVPVSYHWQVNERHYGALQGLNKAEMAAKYGDEQVFVWRRSYGVRPPMLTPELAAAQAHEPHLAFIPEARTVAGESLADCVARVEPWFNATVVPLLRAGQRVLIVASNNSLRALIKLIDNVSDDAIAKITLPTAIPWVYELDAELKPLKHYYVGDSELVARRIAQAQYTMYHVDGTRGPQ